MNHNKINIPSDKIEKIDTNSLASVWLLSKMNNEEVEKYGVTLEFHVKENKILGKGFCNNYFSNYTFDGLTMKIFVIGATRMFCGETSIMKYEQQYFSILQAITKVQRNERNLELSTLTNDKLIFRKIDE